MKKRFDCYKFLTVFTLFLMPISISILIVMLNNYEKYDSTLKTAIVLLNVAFLTTFIYSFLNMIKQKRIINTNRIIIKFAVLLLFVAYVFEIGTMIKFVYYDDNFKDWLITSSASTINHKGLATKIYSKYTVDEVLENKEEIEPDLIDFSVDYDISLYANEYEKEILEREEGTLYKVIKISGNTTLTGSPYVGYLTVIYDPSHIKLAKSTGAGTTEEAYGERLDVIAKKNNALVAINAGGFHDPNWSSNGGIPHGDVFIDGKLDTTFERAEMFGGGIIGFDNENKLILKRMTTEKAIEMGIRDAVDWGPFLIVDGVNKYKGEYSSWEVGRTAIAQRADGIVLFLVIDNLQSHSKGVNYADEAAILEKYGAVTAANLDGGTSTAMVENGEYVNSPWNGSRPTFRRIPNAWIVVE